MIWLTTSVDDTIVLAMYKYFGYSRWVRILAECCVFVTINSAIVARRFDKSTR